MTRALSALLVTMFLVSSCSAGLSDAEQVWCLQNIDDVLYGASALGYEFESGATELVKDIPEDPPQAAGQTDAEWMVAQVIRRMNAPLVSRWTWETQSAWFDKADDQDGDWVRACSATYEIG